MGSVVLSVDAALAWAFNDKRAPPLDRIRAGRQGWLALLELLDEYRVPATWGVVGHLFLSDCDGTHPEHPAPIGWFGHERGPGRIAGDLRYGRDLITAVRNAAAPHEIASLTFSHVELGDPNTANELARAEVARCLELAHRDGLDVTSFVFPRNEVGHRDVLAAYGVRCYRGAEPDETGSGLLRPARKLATAAVGDPPPLVRPAVDEFGLVDVPASLFLFGFEGLPRTIVEPIVGDPIVRQARKGIDRAAETDRVFHMWLRPSDLVDGRDVDRMRSVLGHLDRRREETSLRVETMGQVAGRVLDEQSVSEPELVR